MLLNNRISPTVKLSSSASSAVYILNGNFYPYRIDPSSLPTYPFSLIFFIYCTTPSLHNYMLYHLYLTFSDGSKKSFGEFVRENNLLR